MMGEVPAGVRGTIEPQSRLFTSPIMGEVGRGPSQPMQLESRHPSHRHQTGIRTARLLATPVGAAALLIRVGKGCSQVTDATYMRQEIEEIPSAVARLLSEGQSEFLAGGAALRERDPAAVVTIARGSSDHASAFLKYAIELLAGVPVASVGPSIVSIYGRELRLGRAAAISISQSGRSPDIVAMTESARRSGALTFALTNTLELPAGAFRRTHHRAPLRRGEERRRHQDLRRLRGRRPGAPRKLVREQGVARSTRISSGTS